MGPIIGPILKLKGLRLREAKELAQGHTANKSENHVTWTSKPLFLISVLQTYLYLVTMRSSLRSVKTLLCKALLNTSCNPQ